MSRLTLRIDLASEGFFDELDNIKYWKTLTNTDTSFEERVEFMKRLQLHYRVFYKNLASKN